MWYSSFSKNILNDGKDLTTENVQIKNIVYFNDQLNQWQRHLQTHRNCPPVELQLPQTAVWMPYLAVAWCMILTWMSFSKQKTNLWFVGSHFAPPASQPLSTFGVFGPLHTCNFMRYVELLPLVTCPTQNAFIQWTFIHWLQKFLSSLKPIFIDEA